MKGAKVLGKVNTIANTVTEGHRRTRAGQTLEIVPNTELEVALI